MLFSTETNIAVKRFGIKEGIRVLAEAGFPCLDISFCNYVEEIRAGAWLPIAEEYKKAAELYGVKYNQGHAPFGGGALPDGRSKYVVERAPLMPESLKFAAACGIETVIIHPLNFMEIGFLGNEEFHFEKNMEFFSKLTPIAGELGVKIGLENLWHTNELTGNIIGVTCADPREHIRYVTSLNAPDVYCACLDLGHCALVGRKPEDSIRAIGGEVLRALHVHDVDYKSDLHTAPFYGKLNWDEICHALADIDYKGVLTLEADNFITKLPDDLIADGIGLMSKIASNLAQRIDSYR